MLAGKVDPSPNSDEGTRTDESLAAMAGVVNTFGGIIGGMKRQSITQRLAFMRLAAHYVTLTSNPL